MKRKFIENLVFEIFSHNFHNYSLISQVWQKNYWNFNGVFSLISGSGEPKNIQKLCSKVIIMDIILNSLTSNLNLYWNHWNYFYRKNFKQY
jgi:hypothetical protein